MSKRFQHLLTMFALAGLVAMTACQQRQEIEDEEGADTLSTSTEMAPVAPPAEMPADTAMGGGAMGATSQEISVTNSMPHSMIVKADAGQGETELGTVAPNETKSFTVQAASGAQVTLTAADSAATHSTSGSVTVGGAGPATWTIQ